MKLFQNLSLIFFIILIYALNIFAINNSDISNNYCRNRSIKELEKRVEGITPPLLLSQKELFKRGRISKSGKFVDSEGSKASFYNILDNTTWQQTPATCRKVTSDIYLYIADDVWYDSLNNPAGYITQKDVDDISSRFSTDSTSIYRVSKEIFGNEKAKGIDGDTHVTIFILDLDNTLSSKIDWWKDNTSTWLGGYSTKLDNYVEGTNETHSNERKIIYLDAYPTFEHGSVTYDDKTEKVKVKNYTPTINHNDDDSTVIFVEGPKAVYSILAHEFQHKIHENYDPDEESFLNEGCSDLSEILNGLGPQKAHLRAFLENSNSNLLEWDDNLSDYGSVMLLLTYLYEHYGEKKFINNLVKDTEKGVNSINKNLVNLGYLDNFNFIFNHWVIANYFSDTTSTNLLNNAYVYKSINLYETTIFKTTPKKPDIIRYGMNPLKRYELNNSMKLSDGQVNGYAGIYLSFIPIYDSSSLNLTFEVDSILDLDVRIGMKKIDNTYEFKYIPLSSNNVGKISIPGVDTKRVKELVLIIINQDIIEKKYSVEISLSKQDKPFSPENFLAFAGKGKNSLTWTENSESSITIQNHDSTFINDSTYITRYFAGYNLYRSEKIDKDYKRINKDIVKVSSYSDEGLSSDISYYYKATALMAKITYINNKISNIELLESLSSSISSAQAYPNLESKTRSVCFISKTINFPSVISKILLIRDKYFGNSFIGKKITNIYYNVFN